MQPFSIARLPRIEFGSGAIARLPSLVAGFGQHALIVTGGRSFMATPHWARLVHAFKERRIHWRRYSVPGEPSPAMIDEAVQAFADHDIHVVVGIGGGSALDAAKAIAGLLRLQRSVMDYLEGVGPELPYEGPATPFIAVPTTAGTGSEATKNAVLSVLGKEGFKKSFRHDRLVAEYALIDPDLLSSCPREVIAANGMDALTQLIESCVSTRANVFTDAMAISGLRAARDGLMTWYEQGADAPMTARENMAYAALISGITLAQVGLGSVHGLASPLGAFFPIPHGVVCGTLVAEATKVNIDVMRLRDPANPGLERYARVADVLCEKRHKTREEAWEGLIRLLADWTTRLALPPLSRYGVAVHDFDRIVCNARGSSMKTNPVDLTDEEIRRVLAARL